MEVDEFQWDDENEAKIDRRLGVRSVDSLLDTAIVVFRNKRQEGCSTRYRLIGKDFKGRWIITVIAELLSASVGLWRPITGWESTTAEKRAARRKGLR